MQVELILPTEMTLEDIADRLARAAWRVLAGDHREWGGYQGTYVPVCEAIADHLARCRISEQPMGGVRAVRLDGDAPENAGGLEAGLTRAIACRVGELFSDLRAFRLVTHDLPGALHEALRPYAWVDADAHA